MDAPRGRAPLVLLVDDNVDACDLLGDLLARRGFEVALAYGAREALARVAERVPAAAILDLGLPEIDGYELAGRLRADPRLDATRLIALTGYATAGDREKVLAAGFDTHLVKPAALDVLIATLGELVGPPPAGA